MAVQEHWIFLRGLMRDAAHWGDFVPMFERAFPTARVHCLDICGNGRHFRSPSPLSVREMMQQLRAEARAAAAPDDRFHVFALSLGAMVALEWAHRYPSELGGVVLVNTSLGGYSPFYQRMRPTAWLAFLRSARERDPRRLERAILDLISNRVEIHETIAEEWAEVRRKRPVHPLNALRQIIAAARYRPSPNPPPVPHLILCGLRDGLVDPECSRTIQRRWHGTLRAHPTGGHDLTLDAGPWVIEEISAWRKALVEPKRSAAMGRI